MMSPIEVLVEIDPKKYIRSLVEQGKLEFGKLDSLGNFVPIDHPKSSDLTKQYRVQAIYIDKSGTPTPSMCFGVYTIQGFLEHLNSSGTKIGDINYHRFRLIEELETLKWHH